MITQACTAHLTIPTVTTTIITIMILDTILITITVDLTMVAVDMTGGKRRLSQSIVLTYPTNSPIDTPDPCGTMHPSGCGSVFTINCRPVPVQGQARSGQVTSMATIKDVARLANVSVSTVSRVINNSGYVAKEVYDRVVAAMEQLNYRPNAIARGLVSRKTATIGLIIPDVANPFFSDIARGVEDEAIASGYTVILCNTDWKLEREQMYVNLLQGKWVEGIVLVGSRTPEQDLIRQLNGLPVILADRKPTHLQSAVWSDNEVGAYIATKHLIDIGCRKIAHISGPDDSPSAAARRAGFRKAVEEEVGVYGTIAPGDFRYDGGYEAAMKLFSTRDIPDGIFAANDMMAIAVVQAANRMGIRIPDDVKLVGYDNILMSEYVYPSITTVEQRGYDMGREASRILIARLDGRTDVEPSKEFEPSLLVRHSTRIDAAHDTA
jgi:LacI family transcriptional regulator